MTTAAVPTAVLAMTGQSIWVDNITRAMLGGQLQEYIAKWSAPHMFAYILIYCVVRNMNGLPVNTLAVFDMGFTSYCVFIVATVVSAFGTVLPEPQTESHKRTLPLAVQALGDKRSPAYVIALLTVTWAVLFCLALRSDRIALRLDKIAIESQVMISMFAIAITPLDVFCLLALGLHFAFGSTTLSQLCQNFSDEVTFILNSFVYSIDTALK